MPVNDKLVQVTMVMTKERQATVIGERVAPGLVMTPCVGDDGTFQGGWSVTHEATGRTLSRYAACIPHTRRALPKLTVVDWTRPDADLAADPAAASAAADFAWQMKACGGICGDVA
jgi:hypothetical protein